MAQSVEPQPTAARTDQASILTPDQVLAWESADEMRNSMGFQVRAH